MNLKEFFKKHLGVNESYQLPDVLMETLEDKEKTEKLFDLLFDEKVSISVDSFNEYFEEGHGNRKNFMQDFTPSSITKLISKIVGENNEVLDVCAGVGALSAEISSENLQVEELSERAFPILLFSLAIRNKNAIVRNGNVLTGEFKKTYKLEKSEKYSTIHPIEDDLIEENQFDLIISNPPYSLNWEPKNVIDIERYMDYETAPKSKADYAFLVGQLNRLNTKGQMAYVFPHGVLFREGSEGKIRRKLLENNLIDTIIGLPEKMFTNTSIPTCIMVLKKDRKDKSVLFIDASKECEKGSNKNNFFSDENIRKISDVFTHRFEVERFSYLADFNEIQENDFNLNIPRYVDTYIPEPIPNLLETVKELFKINDESIEREEDFFKMILDLKGSTEESQKELEEVQNLIKERYFEAR